MSVWPRPWLCRSIIVHNTQHSRDCRVIIIKSRELKDGDCMNSGWSNQVWKVKPMQFLKPKEGRLYGSLWENEPPSRLISYLSKQFCNEFPLQLDPRYVHFWLQNTKMVTAIMSYMLQNYSPLTNGWFHRGFTLEYWGQGGICERNLLNTTCK